DDRHERGRHARADRCGDRPDRVRRGEGPSLARRAGDRDRGDRRPRARGQPRARGRRGRGPSRPHPQALQAGLEPVQEGSAQRVRHRRAQDRRSAFHDHRWAVHGRVARAGARHRRGRPRRRRAALPRRRLQAALLAVLLPGVGRGRAAPAGRGQGGDRPADRHRGHGRAR
ncbi:MAG: 2-keto-3-deoxy-D-arabino-heptulosonate-7-phosphate synthase I beta, partial [uncultured Solirubrobacterales bacterium]